MLPRVVAFALLFSIVTFATRARAQVDPVEAPSSAFRVGGTLMGGYALLHRTTSDPINQLVGITWGGETRVHPYSDHGFVLAYSNAGSFGPSASIADAAYSLRIVGGRPLRGVTGAVYLDLGPSIGFVTSASPTPDHTVVGGRVSATADLQIDNFTLGFSMGYRGGVPVNVANDPWEGEATAVFRLGVAFDLRARRAGPR